MSSTIPDVKLPDWKEPLDSVVFEMQDAEAFVKFALIRPCCIVGIVPARFAAVL